MALDEINDIGINVKVNIDDDAVDYHTMRRRLEGLSEPQAQSIYSAYEKARLRDLVKQKEYLRKLQAMHQAQMNEERNISLKAQERVRIDKERHNDKLEAIERAAQKKRDADERSAKMRDDNAAKQARRRARAATVANNRKKQAELRAETRRERHEHRKLLREKEKLEIRHNHRMLEIERRRSDRQDHYDSMLVGRARMRLRTLGTSALRFGATMAKIGFVAVAGQAALFTTALLGVNAALAIGRASVATYQAALKGLVITAAAAGTALATILAARRQYNEALLTPFVLDRAGGSYSAAETLVASRVSRGLQSQTAGLLGAKASRQVTAAIARSGLTAPGMANAAATNFFNIAGGDTGRAASLAESLASGDVVGAVAALKAARGVDRAALEGRTWTSGQLLRAVASGQLTAPNFSGLAGHMGTTMWGALKGQVHGTAEMLANVGEPMMGAFTDSLLGVSGAVKSDIIGAAVKLRQFGIAEFAPAIESILTRTSNWFRKGIVENIANVDTYAERITGFFVGIDMAFKDFGGWLRSYSESAYVVRDMFRVMGKMAGGRGMFRGFADMVVENQAAFRDFGRSIGVLTGGILDLFNLGQHSFFSRLEGINTVLERLGTSLLPAMGNLMTGMSPILALLPNAIDGLASVLNMLAPIIRELMSSVAALGAFVQGVPGGGELTGLLLAGGLMAVRRSRRMHGAGMAGGSMLAALRGSRAAGGAVTAAAAGGGRMARVGSALAGSTVLGAVARRTGFGRGGRFYSPIVRGTPTPGNRFISDGPDAMRHLGRGAGHRVGQFRGAGMANAPWAAKANFGGLGAILSLAMIGGQFIGDLGAGNTLGTGFVSALIDAPLLSGLNVLGALGYANPLLGLGLGGLAAGVGGAFNAYRTGGTSAGNALASVGGGAALGAAVGSVVPGLGTLAGAGLGAGIGYAANAVAAWFGNRKKRDASRVALEDLVATGGPLSLGFGSPGAVFQATRFSERLSAAMSGEDGDTAVFGRFLRDTLRIDPDKVHRNDLFDALEGIGYADRLRDRLAYLSEVVLPMVGDTLADALDSTSDVVFKAIRELGINIHDGISQVEMVQLFSRLNPIDRDRGFLPRFGDSPLMRNQQFAAAREALNSVAYSTRTGQLTAGLLADFTEQYSAYGIGMGISPDIAGLAGVHHLYTRAKNEPHHFQGEDYDMLLESTRRGMDETLRMIAEGHGIDFKLLKSKGLNRKGEIDSNSIARWNDFIVGVGETRAAFGDTGGMSPEQRLRKLFEVEEFEGLFGGRDVDDVLGSAGTGDDRDENISAIIMDKMSQITDLGVEWTTFQMGLDNSSRLLDIAETLNEILVEVSKPLISPWERKIIRDNAYTGPPRPGVDMPHSGFASDTKGGLEAGWTLGGEYTVGPNGSLGPRLSPRG